MDINESKNTQRLRGVLDHCLLAMIAEKPRYGFEMIKRLLDEEGLSSVGEGSIYPLLTRLERAGLIAGYIVAPEGKRKRKYYKILPAGEERLRVWTRDWMTFKESVDDVLGVNDCREETMGVDEELREPQPAGSRVGGPEGV